MAISTRILNNTNSDVNNQTTNTQCNEQAEEAVTTFVMLENNPDHQSAPDAFHCHKPVTCKLYASFEEAKNACDLIFLKPGEAHTEFYKKDNEYHCVVAIGNIRPNCGHLYLTDSGSEYSLDDIIDSIHEEVVQLSKQFSVLNKDVSLLNENVTEFELNVNSIISQILDDINNFKNQISSNIDEIASSVNDALQQVEDISVKTLQQIEEIEEFVSGFDSRITKNSDDINSINTSIHVIQNHLDNNDSSISYILDYQESLNASMNEGFDIINNANSSILNINEHLTNVDNEISIINSSILNIELKDSEQDSILNTIDISINNIDLSILEIKNTLSVYDQDIQEIQNQLPIINEHLSQLDSSLNSTNAKLNDVSTTVDNHSLNIADMAENISGINSSIGLIENSINGIISDISIMSSSINVLEENVNQHSSDIQGINSEINEIDIRLSNLDSKTDNTNIDLIGEQYRNNIQDTSINVMNETVQDILTTLQEKSIEINTERERNDVQDASVSIMHADISDIQQLINALKPIDDSSIYPIFHDDIYTINLCCYTKAGYIKIEDNIAGINAGGDNTRVAECTPFNEYKTYIQGDTVQFTAIENPGYRFICWYKDGDISSPIYDKTVSYTFGEDINVIGSLLDGVDPNILNHGYTAKFKKLHSLKVSINCVTSNPNTVVKYFEDSLSISITEPDSPTRHISIADALAGKVYYDDGAKIIIEAIPDVEGNHDFTKYLVYDGIDTVEYTNPTYQNRYATTSYIIEAFFIEYWVRITADARPSNAGSVNIVGDIKQLSPDQRYTYYLAGTQIRLSANANVNWSFATWGTDNNHPVLSRFEQDIRPFSVEDDPIILKVNKTVDEYEIKATFDTNTDRIRVMYFEDDTYENQYYDLTQIYSAGSTIVAPDITPTKVGHIFTSWICENPDYQIGSTIDRDLRFYASWHAITYTASFYKDNILYDGPMDVIYNTSLGMLNVENPSDAGRTFIGWETESEIVDNDYLITDDTRFDASMLFNTYVIQFQADSSAICDPINAIWNTPLNTILPENPTKTGHEFIGWTENQELIDPDEYLIEHDTVFNASFIPNQYHVTFISNNEIYGQVMAEYNEEFGNIKPGQNPTGIDGSTFIYWVWDGTDVSVLDTDHITENTSFIAEFTISKYVVDFISNGETLNTYEVYHNTTLGEIEQAIPTSEGYNFISWVVDGEEVSDSYLITKNTSFIAEFEEVLS